MQYELIESKYQRSLYSAFKTVAAIQLFDMVAYFCHHGTSQITTSTSKKFHRKL